MALACLAAALDSLKYSVFITWYVANLLSIACHLIKYIEATPAPFCSERGIYSWSALFDRKIFLFHHLAFLLMVAFFSASNKWICAFLFFIDTAFQKCFLLRFYQPPFSDSSTAPTRHWWAFFQLQNNQLLLHTCLKAAWVLQWCIRVWKVARYSRKRSARMAFLACCFDMHSLKGLRLYISHHMVLFSPTRGSNTATVYLKVWTQSR